jgi:hypothetical protein
MGVAECTTVKITREAVPEPQSSKNLFDDSRRLGVYVPACLRLRKVSYGAAEHRCPPARRADEIDSRQVWKGEYADFTPSQLHSVRHVDVDDPDLVVRATSPGRGARKPPLPVPGKGKGSFTRV